MSASTKLPLFKHATGQWAKKINGKTRYFGNDLNLALAKYYSDAQGTTPDYTSPTPALGVLAEAFLQSKLESFQRGELSSSTLADYKRILPRAVAAHSSKPASQLTRMDIGTVADSVSRSSVNGSQLSPRSQAVQRAYVRAFFNWLDKNRQISRDIADDAREALKAPSRRQVALHDQRHEKPMPTPEDIRRLIEAAAVWFKPVLFLGINGAMGPTDLAGLQKSAVEDGWLKTRRSKTGVARRFPLWPETKRALAAWDTEDSDLLLTSHTGKPIMVRKSKSRISEEMSRLRERTGSELRFYDLRRVFASVADRCGDPVAVSFVMGHAPSSQTDRYRRWIEDSRVEAAVSTVRDWLLEIA